MNIRKLFNYIVTMGILAVTLLFLSDTILISSVMAEGPIGFTKKTITTDFAGPYSAIAIDIDSDGDVDVLGASFSAQEIAWWENDGSENFTKHIVSDTFPCMALYSIDLDNDGDVDVLGAAHHTDEIAWWENDGNENFSKHTSDDNFDGPWSVYAVDMDSDGDIDVLAGAHIAPNIDPNDGRVTWWENDGNENFTAHAIASNLQGAGFVYAVDLDSDEDTDVLVASFYAKNISWWENDGSQSFTRHIIADNINGANSAYPIDMDFDGDLDILSTAVLDDDITWWENDGNESFIERTIDDNFDHVDRVRTTDLDSDGDIDVVGTAADAGDLAWWENDGSQYFTKHIIDNNLPGAKPVNAIDMDGDGDKDVLSAAWFASDIIWYENTSQSKPIAVAGGPYLGAVKQSIAFNGSGSSDPDEDSLTYTWDFGDTSTGTGEKPSHSYAASGIYDVCLTVNDSLVDSDPSCTLAVIYDPDGGFVTGGGWIYSDSGWCQLDEDCAEAEGKANFGFVSKYKKGANVPTGNTEFNFKAGGLNFHSSSYDWLVVNQNGSNAQYKGSGTINGAGDYKFMLWAKDLDPDGNDTFRIKIWHEEDGETVVYDNGFNQEIGGGNIVVHTGKK